MRTMKLAVAALLAMAGALAPSRARADEPTRYSLGLELRASSARSSLGGADFSGYGAVSNGTRTHLDARGIELGVANPIFHIYDLAIGASIGAGYGAIVLGYGTSGADASPTVPALAQQLDTGSLSIFRAGFELGADAWTGPVRWQLGSMFAIGAAQMPFVDVEARPGCRSCKVTAATVQGWVQPRLSVEWVIGPERGVGFGIGAYAADNLLHPYNTEVGLTFALRFRADSGHASFAQR